MKPRLKNIIIVALMLSAVATVPWPGNDNPEEVKSWKARFEKASRQQLGTDADAAAVREMILRDIEPRPHADIKELRWESPVVVIATAFWWETSDAGARLLFAVEKKDGQWKIVLHHYTSVS